MRRATIGFSVAALLIAAGHAAGQGSLAGVMVLQLGDNSGAVTISGNGQVHAGPMYVNSKASNAITGSGEGILNCSSVKAVGNSDFSGNFTCTTPVQKLASPVADPCSGLAWPSPGNSPQDVTVSGARVLSPGTYKSISVSGGGHLKFAPGVFIITGGLSISGGTTVEGAGVTIIMHGGAISLSGNNKVTFSPPISGAYTGITIAQPPSNPSKISMSGTTDLTISGTIYAPGAEVGLSGDASAVGKGPLFAELLVADKLTLSGNGVIRVGVSQNPNWTAPLPKSLPLHD